MAAVKHAEPFAVRAVSSEVILLIAGYAKNERENLNNEDKKTSDVSSKALRNPSKDKITPLGTSIVQGLEEGIAHFRGDI
jgi:hypothetical protein